jgi:Ulp1 family protease
MFTYTLSSSTADRTPIKRKAPIVNNVDEVDRSKDMSIWYNRGAEETYKILMSVGVDDSVLEDYEKIGVSLKELHCLRPKGWLNDEVINAYLEVLGSVFPQKNVKIYYSFVFTYISETRLKDIGTETLLFFPLNWDNMHWSLAVVNMLQAKIIHYDSLDSSVYTPEEFKAKLEIICRWLKLQARKAEYLSQDFNYSCNSSIPKQHNTFDCGVFMLFFYTMLYFDQEKDLAKVRLPLHFMKEFRKHICFTIVTKNQDLFDKSWLHLLSEIKS